MVRRALRVPMPYLLRWRQMHTKGLPRFELERMEEWNTCPHQLSATDSEPLLLKELIQLPGIKASLLDAWDRLSLGYPSEHSPALLRCFADAHTESRLSPDCYTAVIPQEGIFLTMQTLLKPGDHVVAMHPSYQSLTAVAQSIGACVDLWNVDPHSMQFKLESLETLIRPNTKLVITNLPHNPTGTSLAYDQYQEMISLLRSNGSYLFCDEMYRGLEHGNNSCDTWPGPAALPACSEMYEKGVSLGGLSKSWGLAGLRLGWISMQERNVLNRINELKDYTSICPSAPSELLAMMALDSSETRNHIISRQRRILTNGLASRDAFLNTCSSSVQLCGQDTEDCETGGTMCMVELLDGSAVEHASLLARKGVMVCPGKYFNFDESDRLLRVGFARADVAQGFHIWEKHLTKY